MTSIDDARDARVLAAADAQVRPALDELARMIAIPSVSSQPRHAADVAAMAAHLVGSLRGLGWSDVRTIAAGSRPAVLAHWPAPQGRPTVCLYSHYDVQPVGDPDRWSTDPFTATERDGRLHGRGAADDKGGLAMHLAALRAHDGRPPVGVTVLFEGEEELGSPSLDALLAAHRDELAADAYVIADCENWRVGVPTFTTSLRGVADMVIEVRALERAVHSGEFGGVVPDALTGLCRLLAGLHDENGDVAVAGLVRGTAVEELDHPLDRLRAAAGVLDGVELIGTGSVADRLWAKPSISIIGMDTTPIAASSNALIPSARARVSLRIAPGDTRENAVECLRRHVIGHAPWGLRVECSSTEAADPSVVPFEGPIAERARRAYAIAYGAEPVRAGTGGSIGMIASFQAAFPDATVLCTAVADPDCRMHGPDESLELGDFARACRAEALLLDRLGR